MKLQRQPFGWMTVGLASTVLVGLVGCAAPSAPPQAPEPTSPAPVTIASTPLAVVPESGSSEASDRPLAGKVIVVDPGHNGRYRKSYNTKLVPAGNGKRKACNSSGTAGSGLSEHQFNWLQAKALRTKLQNLGAKVVFTRSDDDSLGPCVNLRAKVANDAKADLMISIHADGNLTRGARGFHVIRSTTMDGGSALERSSKQLAERARKAIEAANTRMPRSTYIGKGTALSPRSDIATLNLLQRTPGIMLELGNMRNASDLKLQKSAAFRDQIATALAAAAVATLG